MKSILSNRLARPGRLMRDDELVIRQLRRSFVILVACALTWPVYSKLWALYDYVNLPAATSLQGTPAAAEVFQNWGVDSASIIPSDAKTFMPLLCLQCLPAKLGTEACDDRLRERLMTFTDDGSLFGRPRFGSLMQMTFLKDALSWRYPQEDLYRLSVANIASKIHTANLDDICRANLGVDCDKMSEDQWVQFYVLITLGKLIPDPSKWPSTQARVRGCLH